MNEVVIPGVDGDLTGVLLEPDCPPAGEADGPAGLPAVVVLPEIDGFCEGTVAAARRLAAAGYVALALDLYAPYGSAPRLRNSEDTRAWLGSARRPPPALRPGHGRLLAEDPPGR